MIQPKTPNLNALGTWQFCLLLILTFVIEKIIRWIPIQHLQHYVGNIWRNLKQPCYEITSTLKRKTIGIEIV